MKKYKHIALSFLLFLIAVPPYILKLKKHNLEPYPAIILPAGAGLIERHNTVLTFASIEAYAKQNNKWLPISSRELLENIPNHYFYEIVKGKFGLEYFKQETKLYKPPLKFSKYNRISEGSVLKSKQWLRSQLKSAGFEEDSLKICHYNTQFDVVQKQIINKQLKKQEVYDLAE